MAQNGSPVSVKYLYSNKLRQNMSNKIMLLLYAGDIAVYSDFKTQLIIN